MTELHTSEQPAFAVGEHVAERYVIRRSIHQGGAGDVYEAEHTYLRRRVALKSVRARHQHSSDVRARLLREAELLAVAEHESIVRVFDAGETNQSPYLVLELLSGRALDGLLTARGMLTPTEAVRVVTGIARGVAHLHGIGIVHRDLKPSNVFVTAAGVKLIDLGAGIRSTPTLDDRLTRAGEFVGTLEYAPPEAFVGRGDSPSRDVFALGAILYECLLGQTPFEAKSVAEAITQTSAGLRKRPAELRAQISQSLDDLLVRTLSPSPAARPRDARALLEQLEAVNVAEAPRPQGPESRRDPRAVYVSPVRIQCADGRTLDGRTEDISQSGTLVVLPNGGKVEGTVRLRMVSPITGKAVAVSAVARWARSTRGRDAVGLQFNDAPEPLAAEIQSYLQVMAREQGSTVRPQAS